MNDFQKLVSQSDEHENSLYKIECDIVCDELENCHIVDLSVIELGHLFIISIQDGEYLHECQEKHDATTCVSILNLPLVRKNVKFITLVSDTCLHSLC